MNKKIIGSILTALIIAGSTSFMAFASMDNGTIVIGNKAFDLAYANDSDNFDEIVNTIIAGGEVYAKNFNGDWIENFTGAKVSASQIPAVTYKSDKGEIKFDAGDISVPVVKETSYPKTFTSITNEITNVSNVVYLIAVDQYGQAYDITTDSSYKVTATINGMPLSDTETILTTENNMAKIKLNKTLVENDAVVIMLEKFDKDATSTSANLVSTISTNFTVGKDVTITPKSIISVTASVDNVYVGGGAVTLTSDVRDQYNNPADLSVNKVRWIVESGKDLLDTTSELNSGLTTLDENGNTATFKAIKPGIVTISAYNMINGAKATYTVNVGVTKETTIDPIILPKLKVNTKSVANLVIRNTHNEVIDVAGNNITALVYKDGKLSNNVTIEKLDKDGQVATTGAVKSLRFNAKYAGNYVVRVSVKDVVATCDIAVTAEVTTLQSIELGNNIVDNSIIANATTPVYRALSAVDNNGDEINPDISSWTIGVKNVAGTSFNSFASIVYYKHNEKGIIIDANLSDAEGIAVKFDPSSTSVNSISSDTTLIVTVGNKAIDATDVIKDTLNVTVRARSAVKSITLEDTNISIIPRASVKKGIVILDQYGKVITDPSMVKVIYGVKTTAEVSYDIVAKKMYITYTGEAAGTDFIVVESKADTIIMATAKISISDNVNINSIAFDANNYKVYNSVDDTQDQTVVLTYKVNGGLIDVPADAISVIADPKLVEVTTNGLTINVKAKAGVNDATTGIGDSDAVITIKIITANGNTSSINLTLSDDVSAVDKSTVVIKENVDENKDALGTQLVIGKDDNGDVVNNETTGQIILLGTDQYGNKELDVTADTTWTSTDAAIVTVGAKTGLVTAVSSGKTTVIGFYKGKLYSIEVEVPEVN